MAHVRENDATLLEAFEGRSRRWTTAGRWWTSPP